MRKEWPKKIKGKEYARPFYVTEKEFCSMFIFDFERLNPGKDWRDFAED